MVMLAKAGQIQAVIYNPYTKWEKEELGSYNNNNNRKKKQTTKQKTKQQSYKIQVSLAGTEMMNTKLQGMGLHGVLYWHELHPQL